MKPQMPGLEEQAEIGGRTETVLTSAQILRGKFYRTNKGVTRDAFDMAVAGSAEPRALELAINSFDKSETRTIFHNLLKANDRMVEDAKQSLTEVPPEYRHHLNRVGNNAAKAVLEHRYAHVRVQATETGMEIQTRTAGGNERSENYAAGNAANALSRSGINAYLVANSTLQPRALEETLNALNQVGWRGTAFDSDDSSPLDGLKNARKKAGLRSTAQIGTSPKNPATAPPPAGSHTTSEQGHEHDDSYNW